MEGVVAIGIRMREINGLFARRSVGVLCNFCFVVVKQKRGTAA